MNTDALDDICTINTDYADGLYAQINKNTIKDALYELEALKADNARLLALVDEYVAWHEGDCSPHAQLEHEIARLQKAVDGAREVILCIPQPGKYKVTDLWNRLEAVYAQANDWLAANPKEEK